MQNRREFFNSLLPLGDRKKEKFKPILRPPYHKDISLFLSQCPLCQTQACVADCEEEIIVIQADKTPTLNFKNKGCTFCEACAKACELNVLDIDSGQEQINANFYIDSKRCIAHFGTICSACLEPCIDDAIIFNGMFNPVIDDNRCTGCGFCMSRCPSGAIFYKALD